MKKSYEIRHSYSNHECLVIVTTRYSHSFDINECKKSSFDSLNNFHFMMSHDVSVWAETNITVSWLLSVKHKN